MPSSRLLPSPVRPARHRQRFQLRRLESVAGILGRMCYTEDCYVGLGRTRMSSRYDLDNLRVSGHGPDIKAANPVYTGHDETTLV